MPLLLPAIIAEYVAGDLKTFFSLKAVSLYQIVLLSFVFFQ